MGHVEMMGVIAGRVAVLAAAGGAISWFGDFPLFLLIFSAVFILAVALATFGRDPLRAELAEVGVATFVVSRGDNRHFAGVDGKSGLYIGNRMRRGWVYTRDIESMRISAELNQVSLEITTSAPGFPLIQIHFLRDASSVSQNSAVYNKAIVKAEEWLKLLDGKVYQPVSAASFQTQEA